MADIQIEGLQELINKYGTDLRPAIRAATFAVGEQLKGIIAVTPPMRSGPVKWASAKQRAWYFADRARRGLQPQYIRNSAPGSQQLDKSWGTAHTGKLDAELSPGATYAKWVQSAEMQQPMHKQTGWITDVQAIEKLQQQDVIQDIVIDAVVKALGG